MIPTLEHLLESLKLRKEYDGTSDIEIHPPIKVKTFFFSDAHLGSRNSQAKELVSTLEHIDPNLIYIVGDLVDLMQFGITNLGHFGKLFEKIGGDFKLRLRQAHLDVFQKILRFARRQVPVIYIPGNHDSIFRPPPFIEIPNQEMDFLIEKAKASSEVTSKSHKDYLQAIEKLKELFSSLIEQGNISIVPNLVHVTAKEKRYLVLHGDEFDAIIKNWPLLEILGTKARERLFQGSNWLSRNDQFWLIRKIIRPFFGLRDGFSLADYAERFSNTRGDDYPDIALSYVEMLNERILKLRETDPRWAGEPLFDGIICGHSHRPGKFNREKIECINIGDFMGNASFLIEDLEGNLELNTWNNEKGIVPLDVPDMELPKRTFAQSLAKRLPVFGSDP
jgi:UDP-2,3-diacylglucosamine pyrophosphatase LpxH